MFSFQLYRNSLEEEARHVLEECWIVVPGVQALIGFQMVAVFNEGFTDKPSEFDQAIHLLALVFVLFAMVLLMTPPTYHRRAEPGRRCLRCRTHLSRSASLLVRVSALYLLPLLGLLVIFALVHSKV